MVKAKAAAEAAQKLEQQQHKPRSWVGGLFRTGSSSRGTAVSGSSSGSNTPAKASRNPSIGSGSNHSGTSGSYGGSGSKHGQQSHGIPPTPLSVSIRKGEEYDHNNDDALEEEEADSEPIAGAIIKEETPLERLQREQEEVQRTMTEKQKQRLKMLEMTTINEIKTK
ncbi:hypothetical protein ACA910_018990 [Epithemia clementina (nom. ined.)]